MSGSGFPVGLFTLQVIHHAILSQAPLLEGLPPSHGAFQDTFLTA
jgi:hypothetical protein